MCESASHLSLYQISTRQYLSDLSPTLGRDAGLADVPDPLLDQLAGLGFEWVWLLGVWQTGESGRRVAREHAELLEELAAALPGVTPADIVSSPFAVKQYRVHPDFGGEPALAVLREKLASRGMRLMLDFVPNHVALDHAWVRERPEYFVSGSEADLASSPDAFSEVFGVVLAHGRDPNFPPWRDTLQLDYGRECVRRAVIADLVDVSRLCDGVRCDMAMLLLNEVFRETWPGRDPPEQQFWPEATRTVRREFPDFTFVAEAYWDTQSELLAQGFDYTYDKQLYDHLVAGDAAAATERLASAEAPAHRAVHFVENHDEPRAASAFSPAALRAASVVTALAPGIFLVHDGQMEGRRTYTPLQLARRRPESVDEDLRRFYEQLLRVAHRPEVRRGGWELLEPQPAAEGDDSWRQTVAMRWHGEADLIAVANLAEPTARCVLPLSDSAGPRQVRALLCSEGSAAQVGEPAEHHLNVTLPAFGYAVLAAG